MVTLRVKTQRRSQMLDVTREVEKAVRELNVERGVCHLYVPHTTAGIAINEHADPDVASDVKRSLEVLIPQEGAYRHGERNSDSHIKTVLTGTSQAVFVENGKLVLGRWQGIFFCEYDGPRERTLLLKIVPDTT